MTLTKKTIRSIALMIISGTVLISVALLIYISLKFRETEIQNAEKDMSRVLGVLDREIESVDTYCKDYAFWDDTYSFMVKYSANYIDANFNPPYLKTQKMHFICHVNLDGRILYNAVYDPNSYEPLKLDDMKNEASVLSDVISMKGTLKEERGIVETSHGFMLIASRPVSDSYMTAPPRGKLVMGRFLSSEEVKLISSMLKVNIEFIPQKRDKGIFEELSGAKNRGMQGFTVKAGSDVIRIYSVVKDIRGNPAAVALLNHSRDIKATGIQTVKFTLVLILLFTNLLFLAMVFFLKESVLSTIEMIT